VVLGREPQVGREMMTVTQKAFDRGRVEQLVLGLEGVDARLHGRDHTWMFHCHNHYHMDNGMALHLTFRQTSVKERICHWVALRREGGPPRARG
jgi:hypothetical protein